MKEEKEKRMVGVYASKFVKDGQVIGLGTGSTVAYFAEALGERILNGESFLAVPTSYQSIDLCKKYGITLTTLDEHRPECAFDGADEVDKSNNLIKGRGGAMTQEKIVDYYSNEFFVLVDKSKLVKILGSNFPLPIEVIPKAIKPVIDKLSEMGSPMVRPAINKDGPVITDNGNFIVDLKTIIKNPKEMEININNIPGVVENGIFTRKCKIIVPNDNDIIDVI
ncbi:MAG TPA: ribose-5-phosphate isomerase RpiA [Candidatus Methanofastidiosa archaeon]|nr:ribose-5-phosphate isomerase RpiA [Candidatus Methanofastidiosa archaeon]